MSVWCQAFIWTSVDNISIAGSPWTLENSGNSQGILAMADLNAASEKCCIIFHICFSLSFQISIMYGSIYLFWVYKNTLRYFWCTLYSRISSRVWKCVSMSCLLSLQLKAKFLMFYMYSLLQGADFQRLFLYRSDNLMLQAFLFCDYMIKFKWYWFLKNWAGAMLGIFVTKINGAINLKL